LDNGGWALLLQSGKRGSEDRRTDRSYDGLQPATTNPTTQFSHEPIKERGAAAAGYGNDTNIPASFIVRRGYQSEIS